MTGELAHLLCLLDRYEATLKEANSELAAFYRREDPPFTARDAFDRAAEEYENWARPDNVRAALREAGVDC